jgi:hypothetical protein
MRPLRCFVTVQWPIADLRTLVPGACRRLPAPQWRDPRPGTEFFRGAGVVRDRPRGPVFGWPGEGAFVDAHAFVKFANDPTLEPWQVRPQYRRLFGYPGGYRIDVGFQVEVRATRFDSDIIRHATLRCLTVPVDADGAPRSLVKAGAAMASKVQRRSSAHEGGEVLPKCVVATRPAVMVEWGVEGRERTELQGDSLLIGPLRVPVFEFRRSFKYSSSERQVRASLWRLHAELETLREIGRRWDEDPQVFDLDALTEFLAASAGRLVRRSRDGVDQPVLIALQRRLSDFEDSELSLLADSVRDQMRGIARQLDLIKERSIGAAYREQPHRRPVSIGNLILINGVNVNEDRFTFNAPSSGVFGSGANVSSSQFYANSGIAVQDIERLLSALDRLAATAPDDVIAGEVHEVRKELAALPEQDRPTATSTMRRALERLSAIGTAAAPVVELIHQILSAAGLQ